MSNITRVADTTEQERALAMIERTAKAEKFAIRLGAKIGKYPQTVILDHGYQDSLIYINSDGKIEFNNEHVASVKELKRFMMTHSTKSMTGHLI